MREWMQMVRQGDASFGEYQEEIWDHIDWVEHNTVKVEPKGKRVQAARAKDGLYWFEGKLYLKRTAGDYLDLETLESCYLNGHIQPATLEYWQHEDA